MELAFVDGKAVVVDAAEQAASIEVSNQVETRALQVRDLIVSTKDAMGNGFLDMCDLLLEAQEGSYHIIYGFTKFNDWVEQSALDMSSRQAFYFLNIARKAKLLGLTRQQLKAVTISSLKQIFELDETIHEKHIRALLEEAKTLDLKTVTKRVKEIKNPNTPPAEYITLKLDPSVKARLDNCIELARKNYGSTMADGEPIDISVSMAVELILESYLQDPNNHPENHQVDAT